MHLKYYLIIYFLFFGNFQKIFAFEGEMKVLLEKFNNLNINNVNHCSSQNSDSENFVNNCENLFEYVCQNVTPSYSKQITYEYKKNCLKSITPTPGEDFDIFVNYIEKIENEIIANKIKFSAELDKVKFQMKKTVEQKFKIKNLKILKSIENTRIMLASDWLKLHVNEFGKEDIMNLFKNKICGKDGLEANAFNNTVDNMHEVVLCPGLLIEGLKNPQHCGSQTNLFKIDRIAFTVAHEFGHSIDGACDSDDKSHAKKESLTVEPWAKNFNECIKKTFSVKDESLLEETGADYWASEAVSQILKDHKNVREDLKFSLRKICFTKEGMGHPDGKRRIDLLIGRQNSIRKLLNCSPSLEEPCEM